MRKLLTLFVTLVALGAQPAFAHVGGPFSQNVFGGESGASGTYQAVITMKNGSGMCRFSEGLEAQISPFNTSLIFYKGILYSGACYGVVDQNRKKVTGMTNGTSTGYSATVTQTDTVSDFFGTALAQTQFSTFSNFSGVGQNVNYCNTSWTGTVTQTAPVVEFEAQGIAYFFGDLDVTASESVIVTNDNPGANLDFLDSISFLIGSIGGEVELTLDDILRLIDLSSPGSTRTREVRNSLGGESHIFPDIGVQQKIYVVGNRISYNRQPPVSSVGGNDALALTGGGFFSF